MSNDMNITQSLDTSSEIISQNLCTHLHLTPTPSIIEKYHPLPGPCQPSFLTNLADEKVLDC